MRRFLLSLGAVIAVLGTVGVAPPSAVATAPDSVAATPSTFRNPIREGAADPQMVYADGQYHLTYTAVSKIIIVSAKSVADLATAPARTVWTDTNAARSSNMWAPEIHQIDGKWYIYYTAGPGEISKQRNHVIESDSLTGTWTYKGEVKTLAGFAIDGTVAKFPNGKLYYIWSQIRTGARQDTYIAAMSNPWTITGDQVLISQPDQAWEQHEGQVNEGQYVLQRDGKVWIFYSGSQCKTAEYALGRLTWNGGNPVSKGSWTKDGKVFSSSSANNTFGPGHNSFFTSPDGKETWNLYHARTSRDGQSVGSCDGQRSARIDKVNFDAAGNPDLGAPSSTRANISLPGGDPGAAALPNGRYQINAAGISNATLDVLDCAAADNVPVTVYKNLKSPCQYWNIAKLDDGTYKITNASSGKALDVYGCSAANGAKIQQFGYWGAECQKWFIDKVSGGYRLQPLRGGHALSVAGCSTSNERVNLETWRYYHASCQKWQLVKS